MHPIMNKKTRRAWERAHATEEVSQQAAVIGTEQAKNQNTHNSYGVTSYAAKAREAALEA